MQIQLYEIRVREVYGNIPVTYLDKIKHKTVRSVQFNSIDEHMFD